MGKFDKTISMLQNLSEEEIENMRKAAKEFFDKQPKNINSVTADDYFRKLSGIPLRSEVIELLQDYSIFLEKRGYLDSDWWSEEPYAIDEYLKDKNF